MWEYIIGLLFMFNVYKHLNIFLIRRRSKKPIEIIKGAEPYLLHGGKKGVLFLHGFTSTPSEGKELGSYLNKRGFTFYAPLLPGHGTSSERLCLVKWDDWLQAAQQAINTLEKDCSEIYLVGNSLGGNIALCSAKHPKVKGIACLGTPFFFKKHKTYRAIFMVLKRFKIFQKKRYPKGVEQLHKERNHITYGTVPLISLGHVLKMIKESKKALPYIDKPTLIIQSKTDPVTHESSAYYLYHKLKTKNKQLFWIDKSYHNILLDNQRKKAFQEIYSFISS